MSPVLTRALLPPILAVTLVFSLYLCLVAGGFAGGLVAAAGFALHAVGAGVPAARAALRVAPGRLAGIGLSVAAILALGWDGRIGGVVLPVAVAFEIGVYLGVLGTVLVVVLALVGEER